MCASAISDGIFCGTNPAERIMPALNRSSMAFPFLRCHVFVIIAFVEPQSMPAIMYDGMITVIPGTCYLCGGMMTVRSMI
jgi:hypothetical protein